MAKFNAKNLALVAFFGLLLFGVVGFVYAQQALPTGGDSFETAVKIEPGSYEGEAIKDGEPEYFYINVKPGQELQMKGTLKGSDSSGEQTLSLYSEDREEVTYESDYLFVGDQSPFSFSWLPNSEKDLYKYYIKRWRMIGAISFDLLLVDNYDAGSQTDAGDSFEKPISITPGEYTAYLSGKKGTDTKDFYKMAVKKGETLNVKVTPPSESSMIVIVYGSNRAVLKSEWPPNPGAIVEASLVAKRSEDVFVEVLCESGKIAAYTLNITVQPLAEGEAPVGEEEEVMPEVILPSGEVPSGEVPEIALPEGAKEVAKAVGKGIATVIIFWIVGPIIFLVVIGIIIYFFLKKKKTPPSEKV